MRLANLPKNKLFRKNGQAYVNMRLDTERGTTVSSEELITWVATARDNGWTTLELAKQVYGHESREPYLWARLNDLQQQYESLFPGQRFPKLKREKYNRIHAIFFDDDGNAQTRVFHPGTIVDEISERELIGAAIEGGIFDPSSWNGSEDNLHCVLRLEYIDDNGEHHKSHRLMRIAAANATIAEIKASGFKLLDCLKTPIDRYVEKDSAAYRRAERHDKRQARIAESLKSLGVNYQFQSAFDVI
jgi:adenosyl cobinamide kinase/adenosyl cobinamide phosphate guanylyltransferase